jgi:formamidopyrimidine-DNA glycosylase
MPELPEVETIINDLNKKIKGDTIVDFWSDWLRAIKSANRENPASSADEFFSKIQNRKILGARRIGKNIFIDLSGGRTLYIHLKMTGHLLIKPHPNPLLIKERENKKPSPLQGEGARRADEVKNYFDDKVNQYIHHVWKLKSGRTLEFSDLRKFGKIVLDDTDKINNLKEIKALGIDAMSPLFTFQKFSAILAKRQKSPIGLLLMDQNLISGIGNIYRSEILFDAKILPGRKISDISEKKRKALYNSIKKILKKAIKYRGTSDSDYRDTSGAPGNYQKIILVYRRSGQKCKKCDTMIVRKKIGQRSVFFCPICQK